MLKLGQKGKDKITGFKGILISRHQYITGCDQYSISPSGVNKDGELKKQYQFDEASIEITGPGINLEEVSNVKNSDRP